MRACFTGKAMAGSPEDFIVSPGMEEQVMSGLRGLFNPAANVLAQFHTHRREMLLAFIDEMEQTGDYSAEEVQRARDGVERTSVKA